MVEMIEISDRSRSDLFKAVRADLSNHGEDSFDVTLVAGDGERLKISGRVLGTWSPVVRPLLESNDVSLFLPDFDSSSISRVVKLLEMRWEKEEEVTITQEMHSLLNCFGTDPGKMEPVRRCEEVCCLICDLCDERISNVMKHMKEEHGDLVLNSTEMQSFCRPAVKAENIKESEANEDDRQSMWANLKWEDIKIEVEDVAIEDLEVRGANKEENVKVALKQNSKAKVSPQVKTIKCPKCGLSFKNRITLKRHVGVVHFDAELMAKAEGMFEGEKCALCEKICSNKFSKKMHILHHHTEVGPEISHEIEKIMKLASSKGLIRKLVKVNRNTYKSREVKEGIEKAIDEIGDILVDLKDVAGAENNDQGDSIAEVDMVQEQLLKMQDISDEEEEDMSEEETEEKKNDGNIGRTADPYVRRSLRVYSIFNPSVGDLVAEEM